ncbi:MAG: phosphate ABC transporter permease PstA [Peptococcaceae bacterium]|nr:phosphate ABC transporter permease PstA [Peptococcaceae bacterium]
MAAVQEAINRQTWKQRLKTYKRTPLSFVLLLLVCLSAVITVGVLAMLIGYILIRGIPNLTPSLFAWTYNTENVSMMPALVNTVLMVLFSLLIAAPVGIASAIYLVEYAKRGNKFVGLIRVTTETLQGIPSIVYGLFGALFFVKALDWGLSLIAGAFTLAIMILPLIMRTTKEALKSVPDSYREGAFGLGAGRVRTVFRIILPTAVPGILAGVILAIGRIVGESAALIFSAGTIAAVPGSVFDSARTLSVHMYCLYSEGLYTDQAAATAVILLLIVIAINWVSNFVAKRISRG